MSRPQRIERSDSSMDDCNMFAHPPARASSPVQIPLWTIVTNLAMSSRARICSSDSSMDDCNEIDYLAGSDKYARSDSSMDDCNLEPELGTRRVCGSDSSMDDCN